MSTVLEEPPPTQKEESPELVEQFEASGIEALPKRISRYGEAKKRALEVAEYIGALPKRQALHRRVGSCGEYLEFRHYETIDQVRLHAAHLCTQ